MQPTQTSRQAQTVTTPVEPLDLAESIELAGPNALAEPVVWIQLPNLSEASEARKPESRSAATHDSPSEENQASILTDPSLLELDPTQETFYSADSQSVLGTTETSEIPAAENLRNPFIRGPFSEEPVSEEPVDVPVILEDRFTQTQLGGTETLIESEGVLQTAHEPAFLTTVSTIAPGKVAEHALFPISESSGSLGLVGWFARMAPAMILLAMIGAATLLLWFLLSGGSGAPMSDESGQKEWNDTFGPSSPSDPSSDTSPGVTARSDDAESIPENSKQNQNDDNAPTLGYPDGKQQLDTTVQSAWTPPSQKSATPSSPTASSNHQMVAVPTGVIEPLDRIVRRPSAERQANRTNPAQSKQ